MEEAYQLYWQTRVKRGKRLTLVDGREVDILNPGILNRDAGPDFFAAKIRIGGEVVAGNIEVHVNASDWNRHGHSSDPVYANVILHAVARDDTRIFGSDGLEMPQTVIGLDETFLMRYNRIKVGPPPEIRCADAMASFSELEKEDWLEALMIMRLTDKAGRICNYLTESSGDWQQACFVALARALGFSINAQPMEMMARALPLTILHHHADDIFQLESLLFGMSGLIQYPASDDKGNYYSRLREEFKFLCHKYKLNPIDASTWKLARTRPQNFPYRRIALLAAYCHGGFSMHSAISGAEGDLDKLRHILNKTVSDYWKGRYQFSRDTSDRCAAELSPAAFELLCINFVAPLYYAYGTKEGRPEYVDYGLNLLTSLPSEKNRIVSAWKLAGIEAGNAGRSQALIQLFNNYCQPGNCSNCRWALRTLRES